MEKHAINASKIDLTAAWEIKSHVGRVLCVGGNLFYGFGWQSQYPWWRGSAPHQELSQMLWLLWDKAALCGPLLPLFHLSHSFSSLSTTSLFPPCAVQAIQAAIVQDIPWLLMASWIYAEATERPLGHVWYQFKMHAYRHWFKPFRNVQCLILLAWKELFIPKA